MLGTRLAVTWLENDLILSCKSWCGRRIAARAASHDNVPANEKVSTPPVPGEFEIRLAF
jgi:hypothetical protein